MKNFKRITFTFLITIAVLLIGCTDKKHVSDITFIDPSPRGYSQSVKFEQGNAAMIFISGQVAVDENGNLVGKDDLEKQTDQVFKNIQRQVEKAGGTMNDVVKIDCYFKDISAIAMFRKARDRYINLEHPPASTAVQIQRLINEDFLIEIDVIAIVKK